MAKKSQSLQQLLAEVCASACAALPRVKLTLLIGQYAQRYSLGQRSKPTLTETVRHWREYLPHTLPLPHPSPRNLLWFKRNPWLEREVIPVLREKVHFLLSNQDTVSAQAQKR